MTDKPNYSLKDLLNELKEKEKGCGKEFEYTNDYSPHYINCGNRFANTDIILCPTCQAEISALKKGISACEERNKEILKIIDKWAEKWNNEHDEWEGEGKIHEYEIEQLKKQLTTEVGEK